VIETKQNREAAKEGKKRMSGWLIALIVVAGLFLVGAICCNTIGRNPQANVGSAPGSVNIVLQDGEC